MGYVSSSRKYRSANKTQAMKKPKNVKRELVVELLKRWGLKRDFHKSQLTQYINCKDWIMAENRTVRIETIAMMMKDLADWFNVDSKEYNEKERTS